MRHKKTTFALFFGNRGFFPSKLMKEAREEFPRLLDSLGFGCLMMEEATRYGAVSTTAEGQVFADFSARTAANTRESSFPCPISAMSRRRCARRGRCTTPDTSLSR